MTRASPRASLNTSRLVRFLTDLAPSDVDVSYQQFTEKLGQLLGFSDAITLSAAIEQMAKKPFEPGGKPVSVVEDEFLQGRTALVTNIVKSCTPHSGPTRIKLPTPRFDSGFDVRAAYEPYHRFYVAHQQHLDATIRSLRASIRDGIAGGTPQLQQLTVLDACFDEILADKSRRIFTHVPRLLEKRFEHHYQAHQRRLDDSQQTDNPALWLQPGGWLEKYCKDMQTALLAELEVRLQPVLGLIEAFRKEVSKTP